MPLSDDSEQKFELPLLRFLERYGCDGAYQADSDTDAHPAGLLRHRLVVVSGHDEYQTQAQRDAFVAARAAGVNLAFMGANIGYWRVRYEDGRRTVVEYRRAAQDPLGVTGNVRRLEPAPPGGEPVGVRFDGGEGPASIGNSQSFAVRHARESGVN